MSERLFELLATRRGHFRFESGHHGDRWLELDNLWRQPARLTPVLDRLGDLLAPSSCEVVCGPLTGGAYVALAVATRLACGFVAAERIALPAAAGGPSARYALSADNRVSVAGKRVAIVDDVINAGSATRGAEAALREAGAIPIALGALLVLGDTMPAWAADRNLPLPRVAELASNLWLPEECPLCAAGLALETPPHTG